MADQQAGDQLYWVEPGIDAFMLADYAEATNGKLYVMGGGWDTLWVVKRDEPARAAIGALLRVPWERTNEKIQVRVVLERTDGTFAGFEAKGQVVAGRAPHARLGQDTVVAFAAPLVIPSDTEADLVLRMRFGPEERKIPFFLRHAPRPGNS